MNNEQNNTFGLPNQVQPNNQTIPGSTVIPGANLTPIGPNENVSGVPNNQSQVDLNSNINVQPVIGESIPNLNPNPIPGIVTGTQPINQPNIPDTPINTIPNENIISINNNNVVPGIANEQPVSNNPNLGLNTEANVMEQPVLTPNIPINPTSMPSDNNQPINNNLGDATPLTNEGIIEGGEVVSVWKYLGTILLFCIPIVGFIMLFVKAFGNEKSKNIKNFARAYLLLMAIIIGLGIVFSVVFGAALGSMLSGVTVL